ncbi:NADP-dependent oxidoreductase [soil metagenome]
MKRIQYHRYGGPEVMHLEEFTPDSPGAGQVSVRVRAASVNPYDWKVRNGEMKFLTGRRFPRGMGYDFAGVVAAVGSGCTRFAVGDDVVGVAQIKASGAFAELVVAEEKSLVDKPAGLSFADAATIPTVGSAALQALRDKGEFHSGQSVFVHGCLGGVGRAAVQIAAARGAATVAGSCRADSAPQAHELGVDPVVEFDTIPASLRGRFDIVFDTIGLLAPSTARMLLAPGGHIVDIVPTAGKFLKSVLPGPYRVLMTQPNADDLDELVKASAQGALRLPIAKTVPLAHAIDALTDLEHHHTPRGGKLIITANEPATT